MRSELPVLLDRSLDLVLLARLLERRRLGLVVTGRARLGACATGGASVPGCRLEAKDGRPTFAPLHVDQSGDASDPVEAVLQRVGMASVSRTSSQLFPGAETHCEDRSDSGIVWMMRAVSFLGTVWASQEEQDLLVQPRILLKMDQPSPERLFSGLPVSRLRIRRDLP